MQRIPLLAGPRVVVASVEPGSVALRPPAPEPGIADIPEAVIEALRFPLDGEPIARLAAGATSATVVVEPPALPIPGVLHDPRAVALTAVVDELVRVGIPLERLTILIAGGLQRRSAPRDIGPLVTPEFRRRFRGRLVVHDVEHEGLVEVAPGLRVNPALVEADLVVVVSAAESVLHGGPSVLLAAASADALRSGDAPSLLETRDSPGWTRAVEVERALQHRVRLVGVSLALDQPRPTGALRGYPHDGAVVERLADSRMRRLLGLAPSPLARTIVRRLPVELGVLGVLAGPVSVAHAEAVLRAVELRGVELDEPLDAIVVPIPPTTPGLPRERPNPLSAAHLGLALALRLWRSRPPLAPGGTAILLHPFRRQYEAPTQHPYRTFFRDAAPRDASALADDERAAAADEAALADYRRGRTCHPLLPYAEWAACAPALANAGAVLVAGCRDAVAARQLGLVPTHGLAPALEMAHGRAGGSARIGFLLAPPYFPLRVAG